MGFKITNKQDTNVLPITSAHTGVLDNADPELGELPAKLGIHVDEEDATSIRQRVMAEMQAKINETKKKFAPVKPIQNDDIPTTTVNRPAKSSPAIIKAPVQEKRSPGRPSVISPSTKPTTLPAYNALIDAKLDPISAVDDLTAFLSGLPVDKAGEWINTWFNTSAEHFFKLFLHSIAETPNLRALSDKTGIGYHTLYQMYRNNGTLSMKAMCSVLAAHGYGVQFRIVPFSKVAQDYIALELDQLDFKGE